MLIKHLILSTLLNSARLTSQRLLSRPSTVSSRSFITTVEIFVTKQLNINKTVRALVMYEAQVSVNGNLRHNGKIRQCSRRTAEHLMMRHIFS